MAMMTDDDDDDDDDDSRDDTDTNSHADGGDVDRCDNDDCSEFLTRHRIRFPWLSIS